MKFSERWVREWVDPPIDTDELVSRLTAAGFEVESIEPAAGALEHVTVAEIVDIRPHPGVDSLSLCDVDGGGEVHQVVCGAPNVRVGMRTAFARPGARLPDGTKIRESRIRGATSHGMLCSAGELGLGDESEGILEIDGGAPPGIDLVECLALDDTVIEIAVTPNRGDCLSIAGIANELAVACRTEAKSCDRTTAVTPRIDDTLPIALDAPECCPRYVGRVIREIDPTAKSPMWMTERLRRCGVRPLSPVVDVTNYVMIELGQPMHAFDLGKIDTGIRVRKGTRGESLTLLDGSVVGLDADSIVIADESGPLALAGVMGGIDSGVTGATRNVFLESAWFEPRTIALEARRRGMHTDAAHRFERSVASNLQRDAMERATGLLVEIVGGEPGPVIESVDERHLPCAQPIALRGERIRRMLGADIPAHDVRDILVRLGMKTDETAFGWTVTPPPRRPDVGIEVDLIEEIARVVGYEYLPGTAPVAELDIAMRAESRISTEQIQRRLVARGYHEAITYSFVDSALQERIAPALGSVELANPIASDMNVMRTTLWPGLIGAATYNMNRRQSRIRLFETGRVFVDDGDRVHQPQMIGAIAAGLATPEQWGCQPRSVDFYDVKGDVEDLLAISGQTAEFVPDSHAALHPGQTAAIMLRDLRIGTIGSLHPSLATDLKLSGAVLFELRLDCANRGTIPKFKALSKFPVVRRDVSLVLSDAIPASAVRECIAGAGADILENLQLFDLYNGEGIDLGMKSISVALTFQSRSRTLDDTEVNAALAVILDTLTRRLGAVLRE